MLPPITPFPKWPRIARACSIIFDIEIRRCDGLFDGRAHRRLSCQRPSAARLRSLILGGLGHHLVDGARLAAFGIADAMEAPSLADLTDPMQRMFRSFAEATKSDLKALAACIRGARQPHRAKRKCGQIDLPVLSRSAPRTMSRAIRIDWLLCSGGEALDIPGRDHNRAVGDPVYKDSVLEFLEQRP